MSIPKHLIIYEAPRHHHTYPLDLKYGLYSSKINPAKIKHHKHQRKFIKEISFEFDCTRISQDLGTLCHFTRFSGIKKFSLSFADIPRLIQISTKLPIKVMKRSFRKLKRIKQLTIHHLDQLQKNPKIFKSLMLLNSLQSLTLSYFIYSEDPNYLIPLMQIMKLSSQRKYWPCFKSLNIHPFSPEDYFKNLENPHNAEFLQRLLEFLQNLKFFKDLDKSLSYSIDLPHLQYLQPAEVEILSEMSKIAEPMTRIKILDVKHFSKLAELFSQAKNLKRVSIDMHINFEDGIDLTPLNKAPVLTQLDVLIRTSKRAETLLYKTVFTQIQSLNKLTSLSLKLLGTQVITDDLIRDLAKILRNLPELKSFTLSFMDRLTRRDAFSSLENHLCFEEVFQAIGQKKKLEEFSLYFSRFTLRNSDYLFRVLCQSLENLTEIFRLNLSIDFTNTLGDEEICSLAQTLSKLTKLEDLTLQITQREKSIRSKNFVLLLDGILKNCLHLWKLNLQFGLLTIIDDELYLAIEKAIRELRFLNEIKLRFEGKLETKFDPQFLKDLVGQRMAGYIVFVNRNLSTIIM